jgi:hypothetical protein
MSTKTYRAYMEVAHISMCVFTKQIFLKQMIVIQMVKNALHLRKESVIPCPQYMANRLYPEPVRFYYTSQSNYLTTVLVFGPYFHIQFPYKLFLLASRKMICTSLFSSSCIPLDLSTLKISIKTYRRISTFNQMFQDSNGSSRRIS